MSAEPVDRVEEEYNSLLRKLVVDADIAERRLLDDFSDQQLRRSFVRALFAFVEGHVYQIKTIVLRVLERVLARTSEASDSLSAAEIAILREESYELEDRGAVLTQPKFLPITRNLRFTLSIWARLFQPEFTLDCSGEGWAAFREAVGIRNRITHPKRVSEFDLTDEEMLTVRKAYSWYQHSVCKCLGPEKYAEFMARKQKA